MLWSQAPRQDPGLHTPREPDASLDIPGSFCPLSLPDCAAFLCNLCRVADGSWRWLPCCRWFLVHHMSRPAVSCQS